MATWRCPYCGTPQAETARCWVCHRSTTACATCRHFRRGVTAQYGFCGRDRSRPVLTGREQRDCWERPLSVASLGAPSSGVSGPDGEPQPADRLPGYGLWGLAPSTPSDTAS